MTPVHRQPVQQVTRVEGERRVAMRVLLATAALMFLSANVNAGTICNLIVGKKSCEEARERSEFIDQLGKMQRESEALHKREIPREDPQWSAECKPVRHVDADGIVRYKYAKPDCGMKVLSR